MKKEKMQLFPIYIYLILSSILIMLRYSLFNTRDTVIFNVCLLLEEAEIR